MHSLYAHTPTQTRRAAVVQYNTLCWYSIIVLYYEPCLFLRNGSSSSLGLVSLPSMSVLACWVFSTLVCFSCLRFRCLQTLCTVFNGVADSEGINGIKCCMIAAMMCTTLPVEFSFQWDMYSQQFMTSSQFCCKPLCMWICLCNLHIYRMLRPIWWHSSHWFVSVTMTSNLCFVHCEKQTISIVTS